MTIRMTDAAASIAVVLVLALQSSPAGQQAGGSSVPVKPAHFSTTPAEPELVWPLPDSAKAYASIDGKHMKQYVEEIAAISRRSRDAGNQYWGRIIGTPSLAETEEWMLTKLRALSSYGMEVKRTEEFPVAPQWMPTSWSVNVEGGGKVVNVTSAMPFRESPASNVDLETVWVGLGTAADFVGKDVRGKAAFIYAMPTPGAFRFSAGWNGAMKRAEDAGASAIIVVLALPGNVKGYPIGAGSTRIPTYMIGLQDGMAIQELIEQGGATRPKFKAQLQTKTLTDLKSTNLMAVLPGQTDENVVILTHLDAWFEGGNDNASGMATFLGLAEYYAKIPKKDRRRTMYFMAAPAHHANSVGGRWMHDNMQSVFAKTAVNILCEHTAVTQLYYSAPPRGSALASLPILVPSNQLGATWFGVNGSERLAQITLKSFAMFGVPSFLTPIPSPAGELGVMQTDSPSINLIDAATYYHTDHDTASIVPASGLQAVTRAFARIIDEVNKVDLKDLKAPGQ